MLSRMIRQASLQFGAQLRGALFGALACITLSSCTESSSTGAPVSIPRIFVNCRTANCQSISAPNPKIFVYLSTSGCDPQYIQYGTAVSSSTQAISCGASVGCYGEMTSWIDASKQIVTTIPSGTYSVCGIIDTYPYSYPASLHTGDSVGEISSVSIGRTAGATSANQYITDWLDQ